MSFIQSIKGKIRSIGNTQKITRAMEMVSASKLRKAQSRLWNLRPYTQKIQSLMQSVAQSCAEESRPSFFQDRTVKRMAVIFVTSDRGLCGGLNTNLLKTTLDYLKTTPAEGVSPAEGISPAECELALIGHQALRFVKQLNRNVLTQVDYLGDAPTVQALMEFIQCLLTYYAEGRFDGLCIASNVFVNTMIQKPTITPLIPIVSAPTQEDHDTQADYLYEPDAVSLLNKLSLRYIESQIYQAVIENNACEQAARMLAMKNANESADELIARLRKSYHKARQAAITQELSEIVSGAEAV